MGSYSTFFLFFLQNFAIMFPSSLLCMFVVAISFAQRIIGKRAKRVRHSFVGVLIANLRYTIYIYIFGGMYVTTFSRAGTMT